MKRQRGEGKIGLIITVIVVAALAAFAIKVIPVYYSNNKFVEAAGDIAGRATNLSADEIAGQIIDKARQLKITEAQASTAITVSRVEKEGDGPSGGVCTVTIRYRRPVNLYGIATMEMGVDKVLVKPYISV